MRIILVITLIAVILGVSGCVRSFSADELPAPGRTAPDFELKDLNGETVSLSSFRGRPVLLNFWASWCGPCRAEMPYLEDTYRDPQWETRDLVVLAVNIQESRETVQEFVDLFGLTFPVVLDSDATVARRYNVSGIPATYIIDKDGIIKDVRVGAFISREHIDQALGDNLLEISR